VDCMQVAHVDLPLQNRCRKVEKVELDVAGRVEPILAGDEARGLMVLGPWVEGGLGGLAIPIEIPARSLEVASGRIRSHQVTSNQGGVERVAAYQQSHPCRLRLADQPARPAYSSSVRGREFGDVASASAL
jgi:hypothetical protein